MGEAAVVMAAGKGTRMKSDLPKVLHEAAGKPLVQWVIDACRAAGIDEIVVVIGYRGELVREALAGQGVRFAVQEQQLGTGHAALSARDTLGEFEGRLFVLNGDSPLIEPDVLVKMREAHVARAADETLLYVVPEEPLEYGRLIRAANGNVVDVIEERDCTPEQKRIRELNVGFYLFNAPAVWQALSSIRSDNQAAEYYITDVARYYGQGGGTVVAVEAPVAMSMGVNTPEQLQCVETLLRHRGLAEKH